MKKQPKYYEGDITPFDLIISMGDFEAFCRANIIKYIFRYRRKGGLEDLHKARDYLQNLISIVEEGPA